jgi:hypothetical protein
MTMESAHRVDDGVVHRAHVKIVGRGDRNRAAGRFDRRRDAEERLKVREEGLMGNNSGTVFLIGAAASAWLIYDMATATEAPSQTLALMKYFLIAVLVLATLYSGAKWFANPPPQTSRERPASGRARKRKTGR